MAHWSEIGAAPSASAGSAATPSRGSFPSGDCLGASSEEIETTGSTPAVTFTVTLAF